MSHIALYRKWRPRNFDDVVDQQHIVQTLKHSVATGNIAHAYLFCGTRGTGKTSLAKIFANAVNCLEPVDGNPCGHCEICTALKDEGLMDIQEIDAASNNSVDNIRRITDEAVFLPARTQYKVYIIDEVHMLSSGAFNALLKTLEEPPAHVIFILATTEVHRLPATITSRCQRFDFHRIADDNMVKRLADIAAAEGIAIEPQALTEITNQADGALRDAVSLLDQCGSAITGTITAAAVRTLVGVVDRSFIGRLATALADRSIADLLNSIATVSREGKDLLRFTETLTGYYRDLMVVKAAGPEAKQLLHLTAAEYSSMERLAARYEQPDIVNIIRHLSQLISDLKWSGNPKTLLEINLIGLSGSRHKSDTGTAAAGPASRQGPTAAGLASPDTALASPEMAAGAGATTEIATGTGATAEQAAAATSPASIYPPAPSVQTPVEKAASVVPPDSSAPATTDAATSADRVTAPPHPAPAEQTSGGTPIAVDDIKPTATHQSPENVTQTTDPEPTPAAARPLVAADEPVNARSPLWQKTLELLQVDDAFIYCFVISGQVSGTGAEVVLSFPETGKQNYSILTEQRGYRPLKEALKKANNGLAPNLKINLAGATNPGPEQIVSDTDWLVTLQEKARELGIPVNGKES